MTQIQPTIRTMTWEEAREFGPQHQCLILEHNCISYRLSAGTADNIHCYKSGVDPDFVSVFRPDPNPNSAPFARFRPRHFVASGEVVVTNKGKKTHFSCPPVRTNPFNLTFVVQPI